MFCPKDSEIPPPCALAALHARLRFLGVPLAEAARGPAGVTLPADAAASPRSRAGATRGPLRADGICSAGIGPLGVGAAASGAAGGGGWGNRRVVGWRGGPLGRVPWGGGLEVVVPWPKG